MLAWSRVFFFLSLSLLTRNTWLPFREAVRRLGETTVLVMFFFPLLFLLLLLLLLPVFSGLLAVFEKRSRRCVRKRCNNYTAGAKTVLITVCANKVQPNLLETDSDVLISGAAVRSNCCLFAEVLLLQSAAEFYCREMRH